MGGEVDEWIGVDGDEEPNVVVTSSVVVWLSMTVFSGTRHIV